MGFLSQACGALFTGPNTAPMIARVCGLAVSGLVSAIGVTCPPAAAVIHAAGMDAIVADDASKAVAALLAYVMAHGIASATAPDTMHQARMDLARAGDPLPAPEAEEKTQIMLSDLHSDVVNQFTAVASSVASSMATQALANVLADRLGHSPPGGSDVQQ